MPLGPTGGRIMAEIVAAALAAHAPLITGKPEIARPEQRERLYAGFHEMRRRLAAARPDLLVMFVNDHLQNFPYSNLPAFCVGLVDAYDAPSPGGSTLMRIPPRKIPGAPTWGMALLEAGLAGGFDFAYSYEIESWDELSVPLHFLNPTVTFPWRPSTRTARRRRCPRCAAATRWAPSWDGSRDHIAARRASRSSPRVGSRTGSARPRRGASTLSGTTG